MESMSILKKIRCGLNRNQLKYMVIIAMVIDHIAWSFVDRVNPLAGGTMHFIGRLTGPTMAYFVGEGYRYTGDAGRYQKRLALFALLSWAPYVYFKYGTLPVCFEDGQWIVNPIQSVIYTLFLGLTAIRLWENQKLTGPLKVMGVILLCLLSCIGDWAVTDVLACLLVHIYRNHPRAKWTAYTLTFLLPQVLTVWLAGFEGNWFQLGVVLAPLMLILFYNGEEGSKAPLHKWFFYFFYPLHLLALGIWRWNT